MKQGLCYLPMLLGLAACSPHIDPATSAPRTVLYVIPRTDDIRTAIAFVEDKPGSLRTTPGLDKLDNNHVEFFPKDPRTVTYLINDQPVHDRDAIISYLRQNSISNVKLIENANQTHRTFVIRKGRL